MDIAAIAQAVRQWQERGRARRELQRLSDRDLADIGLSRSGIESAVRGDPTDARQARLFLGL